MSKSNPKINTQANDAFSPSPTAGKADRIVGKMASIRVWIAIVSLAIAGLIFAFKAYRIMFVHGEETDYVTGKPNTNQTATVYAIAALIAFALAFVFYRYRTSETLAAFLFISNVMD